MTALDTLRQRQSQRPLMHKMNNSKQLAIRLPIELLAQVDRYTEHMNELHPGFDVSRADAVRVLLLKALALEQVTSDATARPKPRKR
jgi:hypothetical protein